MEYIVLFRLPLNPGSEIVRLLQNHGWQSVNEVTYFRNVDDAREEVVNQIKSVCRESREVSGHRSSAFTVIPVKPGSVTSKLAAADLFKAN
jgi:hypothetical protein